MMRVTFTPILLVSGFLFCSVIVSSNFLFAKDAIPMLFQDDFEHGLGHWQTTDPGKPFWKIETLERDGKPNRVLRVIGKSDYQPPYRSPHSIALVKDMVVGDFEMTVRVQSTDHISGDHRDMCLFWGYQDPSHFYYVHLGAKADPHACQIFIVEGASRKRITVKKAKGTPWSDGWHTVKVVRRVADGSMAVYFDDMEQPMMTARDPLFRWGQVGLGTFDNEGNWDDFQLDGVRTEPAKR